MKGSLRRETRGWLIYIKRRENKVNQERRGVSDNAPMSVMRSVPKDISA
jgi:hypothetical protein